VDFVKERSFRQGLVTLLVQVVILLNVTNGGKVGFEDPGLTASFQK